MKDERREFEKMMAQQEMQRKSQEEIAEKQSKEKQLEMARQEEMRDNSYRMLDLAEKSIGSGKEYLGLHYFHNAYFNFKSMDWKREADTTRKRFIGVYNSLHQPLIDVNELLMNDKIDREYHIINSLTQMLKWKKRFDFAAAQTEIKTTLHLYQDIQWVKSIPMLESFLSQLKVDEKNYLKEIENQSLMPSEEKANKLVEQATQQIKQLSYDKGISLAQEAHEMFIQIGRARDARKIEQELLRWKLKAEKTMKQRIKRDGDSAKKSIYLTDEERRRAILEERKRRRREARKKLRKM